jgi:hypothetical protein
MVPHRPAAERCLEILQAAIPVFRGHLPAHPPDDGKLVITLYAGRKEYTRAVRNLDATAYNDSLAFTSAKTRESHVVLQPRTEPEYLDLVGGLPELTAHLVVHEAAHQWIYRSDAPNARWWPAWYAEGMAEHVADLVMEGTAGDAARRRVLRDDADHTVLDLLRSGRLLTIDRLLHASPATFRRRSNLYAQFGGFYRHLASKPGMLDALHGNIRSLGRPPAPEPGAVDRRSVKFARPCADALRRACGDLETLEREWRSDAAKAEPRWFEPIRAAQFSGDEIICAAFPESNAMLLAAIPKGPRLLEGEFHLTGIGRREAKLYLGFEQRDDPRFVKIDMGKAGFFSALSILPFADGCWQPRYRNAARLPADAIPVKTWVPFRVSIDGRFIRVVVGDACNVMRAIRPPGYDIEGGCWGVGAYDGVVRFRGLKVDGKPVD